MALRREYATKLRQRILMNDKRAILWMKCTGTTLGVQQILHKKHDESFMLVINSGSSFISFQMFTEGDPSAIADFQGPSIYDKR